jgi:hypothetical protein
MTLSYYWKNISLQLLCYKKIYEVHFEDLEHEELDFFSKP